MDGEKGIIMLFTGNGKGKTTASLGAAMRAAGHNSRVFMIQFMKGRLYGELAAAEALDNLTIEQHGRDEFVDPEDPEQIDIDLARGGWKRMLEVVEEGLFDMIILDEINVAVSFGLIPLEEVIRFLESRPEDLDVILTGRYAPDELVELADTVTEMREIKHHYNQGVQMRKGIEF
ncbi:MAG: cob(I)yrinic acid a,c-diamide adenosyltransferase [Candidatus Krumholzibacteriota bacterium]|nr:cob(I)yrinic acid a,c-diamide adenosyltransferase [Candidatus Krumholzibacteriota bacterium]